MNSWFFLILGTYVSSNLNWSENVDNILKKSRQRLYFLRKLRNYGVDKPILVCFYHAIIESVLTASITVWYNSATQADINKLSSVVRSAEKVIKTTLPSLDSIYKDRVMKRTDKILKDADHPSHHYFEFLPSGRRFRTFKGC